MNTKRSSAKALLDIGAVGFTPHAPVTFKSGIRSPVYVDNRRLIFHPRQWHIIIDAFQSTIAALALEYDVIAGVAVGGLPHSSALAYMQGRPSVFIRVESKAHGMGQRLEGGDVKGARALLLEDLVTTGGSSLSAVAALRESGAIVTDVIAIVSYGFAEAEAAFAQARARLHTLTDFNAILAVAGERGLFNSGEENIIRAWLADPHHWGRGGS